MNILITLNRSYLEASKVMLRSLYKNNEGISLFVLSKDLKREDFDFDAVVNNPSLNLTDALTTSRYPEAMYYRLFAFEYLDVDKVLYLDPDIIVNKSLKELYETELGDNYAAGCTHVKEALTKFNALRMGTMEAETYLNTGVLLLNLKKIREDFTKEEIEKVILENKHRLLLPDQDIITLLFKNKIIRLDSIKYNLTDRIYTLERLRGKRDLTLDYVRENTAIIHYAGRNKPWRDNYHGSLGVFYKEYEK